LTVIGPATLNLGGYTLSGLGQGVGVELSPGASVVDGKVRGFNVGVSAARISGYPGALGNEFIEDVRVSRNATDGISAMDPRVGGLHITGSKISRNGRNGILLDVTSSVVDGNHINRNGSNGIAAGFADATTYSNNTVVGNGARGIYIDTGTSRVVNNVARDNGQDGIYVAEGTGLFYFYLIADNTAVDNGGFGIAFFGIPVGGNPPINVDGGGNVAKRNDGPEQCHIIICTRN
jgi:hypothetical protein